MLFVEIPAYRIDLTPFAGLLHGHYTVTIKMAKPIAIRLFFTQALNNAFRA